MLLVEEAEKHAEHAPVDAALEFGIAYTVATAFGHASGLTYFSEVGYHFIGISIVDYGSDRHGEYEIFTTLACTVTAAAFLTILGFVRTRVTIINEGIQVGASLHINATSPATIPPIRASIRNELFTTKVNRAIPTIASLHVNFCMIVKHTLS